MRKTRRLFSQIGPEERLAAAIGGLPPSAQRALAEVADREDLPLVAGVWGAEDGGCLVANVVRAAGLPAQAADQTLDVRVLDLFPEMSSRDLNHLIVAWDEAALQEGRGTDPALRRLLRGALARAGVRAGGQAALCDPADLDDVAAPDDAAALDDPAGGRGPTAGVPIPG